MPIFFLKLDSTLFIFARTSLTESPGNATDPVNLSEFLKIKKCIIFHHNLYFP